MRIVSLLPSATEIICSIGLEDALVGVTHECDWPTTVRGKATVTHTLIPTDAESGAIDTLVREQLSGGDALYRLDLDALTRARPDLIVSQTLCDVCAVADAEVRDALRVLPNTTRVLYLEPTRLEHVFDSIETVASAADVSSAGATVVGQLQERVEQIRRQSQAHDGNRARRRRVVVLEWLDPLFSCGHWTPELVAAAGWQEPLASPGERSRLVTADEVVGADPDAIVIACCGYTVERTLRDVECWLATSPVAALPCVQAGRAWVVDGSAYFSRPGPRLVDSLEILAHTLDPGTHPLPLGLSAATPVQAGA